MAIAIPKAFQTMRNDNEIHTAKTYQEKMRDMRQHGVCAVDIRALFVVSRAQLWRILTNRNWK